MADVKEKVNDMKRHPWETCRAKFILKKIKRYGMSGKIADIGAGDLFFTNILIENLKNVQITAVDPSFETFDSDNDKIIKKKA